MLSSYRNYSEQILEQNIAFAISLTAKWRQPQQSKVPILTYMSEKIYIFFFFLSGFSLKKIHESQDCWGRGRAFL